jgi:spoIIIJ-associated protein
VTTQTARSGDEEDPVVSQRENMAAVTDPVNPDELPTAGEAAAVSDEPVAPGPAAADSGGPPGGAVTDDADAAEPVPGDGEDGDGEDDAEAPAERPRNAADLEQESEIAADYVEGLLDVADLDGDIDMDVEGDRALVSVVGATLSELVGRNGEVLEALQELTRLAVHRQTGVRTRIMLDVGGYRARRRTELTALGREAAEDVSRTGVARRLDPMTPFERKIVHDAVAAAGLSSESEGEEPNRRVVVLPAS